jgi:hypothetical protein
MKKPADSIRFRIESGGFFMALVRARSAPPYALISCIFRWVVATALAVVFYMQFDKADKAREEAERLERQVVKPGEKTLVSQLLEGQSGANAKSALGVAYEQIQLLKLTVAGTDASSKTVAEIANPEGGLVRQTLDKAGQKDVSLVAAVNGLSDQLSKANSDNKALNDRLTAEHATYAAAMDQYKASVKSANDSIDQQKEEVRKLSEQVAAITAERAALADKDEKTLTTAKDDFEKARRQQVVDMDQKDNEIKILKNKIAQLEQILQNLRPVTKAGVGREADGVIVRTNIGEGEAYINLGRRDHVVPGLTFAVYDPKLGVRIDSDAEASGKGGIEVLEVGESESLCRITHTTRGQTIQNGDLIGNVVYSTDKTRKFRFVVYGDFDLDGDGQATSQERERIIRLIQSWGGIVDDALSTQTDFLVIGMRPASPVLHTESSDEAGSIAKAQAEKQGQYDKLVTDAKSSSVPILNQNRFLAMIGYYNTTIVRH